MQFPTLKSPKGLEVEDKKNWMTIKYFDNKNFLIGWLGWGLGFIGTWAKEEEPLESELFL